MAHFHATGAVSDPGKIGPYRDEEMKIPKSEKPERKKSA